MGGLFHGFKTQNSFHGSQVFNHSKTHEKGHPKPKLQTRVCTSPANNNTDTGRLNPSRGEAKAQGCRLLTGCTWGLAGLARGRSAACVGTCLPLELAPRMTPVQAKRRSACSTPSRAAAETRSPSHECPAVRPSTPVTWIATAWSACGAPAKPAATCPFACLSLRACPRQFAPPLPSLRHIHASMPLPSPPTRGPEGPAACQTQRRGVRRGAQDPLHAGRFLPAGAPPSPSSPLASLTLGLQQRGAHS